MNKNMMIVVASVLVIVAGVGGFFAGLQYQKSQRASQFNGNAQGGRRFGGANGGNFTPVRGQVLGIGNNSITIKQQDGTTKIVVVSSTTSFVQTQKALESNLKTGDNVMIIGSSNSDGSVTASNISINPQAFRPKAIPTKAQ